MNYILRISTSFTSTWMNSSEDLQDEIEFDGEYINVYRLLDYGQVLEVEDAEEIVKLAKQVTDNKTD